MPDKYPEEKLGDYIKRKIEEGTSQSNRPGTKNARRGKKPRDPLSGLFWGLLLVLLGFLFFAQGREWITWDTWWQALVIGLGAIFILDAFFHYLLPSSRSYALGRLVPGIFLLSIGLAFLFGFTTWWPLALVATGIALFISSWMLQREIEKRRITQQTLAQSEAQYRHIIDNANSIIMQIDTRGNVTFINKFALELFGCKESEILGQNVVGTIVAPGDAARSDQEKMIQDIVVHPENYLHNEKENLLRSGQIAWIVWTYKPLFDEQNQLKEILCTGIDSTKHKQAEELIAAQLKEKTSVEERNRLARDLHDAVSQTLFSASLIAEVLPKLWERNPEEGRRRLEEIRQLTRGALAEMRTLLLELRPASLKDAELGDLLRQLGESINGRARIPVKVEVEGRCDMSAEVKIGLYRIAQEALNNVAKHSGANQAHVNLSCSPQTVTMVVSDNGKGFDIQDVRAKSLGLGIMKERAREINAGLSIESQPAQGTHITVTWEQAASPEASAPPLIKAP
jgi:PAS domain S-box-containing protein